MSRITIRLIVFAIGVVALVYFFFLLATETSVPSQTGTYEVIEGPGDTAFGGLFSTVPINDSLPHYRYKLIEDSINRVKQQNGITDEYSSEGFSTSGVGTYIFRNSPGRPVTEYYLGIDDYHLKDRSSKFYLRNGTFNLLYTKWDTTLPNGSRRGHYESKQVPVRYSASRSTLFIPVSENTYRVYQVILYASILLAATFLVYVMLVLPLQVILDIAKGRAFTQQNHKAFKLMGITLFLLCIFKTLFPYIFRLIYSSTIPPDFESYSVLGRLVGNWFGFLIAVLLFLIGKAFQRGYQLQQDQNLTI